MSEKFNIRPRFKVESSKTSKELLDKLSNILSAGDSHVTRWVYDRSAQLKVANIQNLWSPQLTIYAEEIEGGTELRCVIGPNSTIWTTIIFFYAIIGMAILIGLIWGASQMTIGHTPYAFLIIPLGLILISCVFIGGKIGQKLSTNEIKTLREFIEALIS